MRVIINKYFDQHETCIAFTSMTALKGKNGHKFFLDFFSENNSKPNKSIYFISAFQGEFNWSTQHSTILSNKEY